MYVTTVLPTASDHTRILCLLMTISGSETCDRRNRRQSPQSKRDHALSVRKPPEYPQRQRIPGLCNSTSGACKYGCGNIITFDAHDARVQNATPLHGFETIQPSYQFIKALLNHEKGLHIDNDHFMIISPDEGSMNRAIYLANILGVDMGMYYKRLDYSKRINGRHPIAAYEFLGPNLKGKDMILIDDMISSGDTVLKISSLLKERGAGRIYICSTFGLFTNGLEKFDEAHKAGVFDKLLTTNLIYQSPELLAKDYYISCDMSKYIALIIDTLNHDQSVSYLLNPVDRINRCVSNYMAQYDEK